MKRNIDDFDGMKDFIISIITVLAWVLIGTIVIIGYFTIETKGEGIILSYISTIFTAISSLGIAATIGVYFWQKKAEDNKQHDINKKLLPYIIKKSESIINIISSIYRHIGEIETNASVYINNDKLALYCLSENNGNIDEVINLKCNEHDDFINNNKIMIDYNIYLFIIEYESCYSRALKEIYEFVNIWNNYDDYVLEYGDVANSKEDLINELKSALASYEIHITKQRNLLRQKKHLH